MVDKPQIKEDGWQNLMTSLGTHRDGATHTHFVQDPILDSQTAEAMYMGDGIARRIVDIHAEEMTRAWINAPQEVLEELTRLNTRKHFTDALRWAGLYGGAIIVMALDDPNDLSEPLGKNRTVHSLKVFSKPEVYRPQDGGNFFIGHNTSTRISVHPSRVLIFDGEDVPPSYRSRNGGWGISRLQAAAGPLSRYGSALGSVTALLQDYVLPVLKMKNLAATLGANQEDKIKRRLEIIGVSRSITNMVLLDADGDEYEKKVSSVQGIKDLLDELKHNLASTTGLPQTVLFGRSPQGMSATGEHDQRNLYDVIRAEQEDKLLPPLERLVSLLGFEPSLIELATLWQRDSKEQADIDALNVNTASTALTQGIWTEAQALNFLSQRELGIPDEYP